MADRGDFDGRDLPHISIDSWREPTTYKYPSQAQVRKPLREDYAAHAASLLGQLAAALPAIPAARDDIRLDIPGLGRGALVALETMPPTSDRAQAVRVPPALEFPGQGVVQLQTRRNPDRTEGAILFVPDASRGFLRGRIQSYGADAGNQRRPDLEKFEVIEQIRASAAESLFPEATDFAAPPRWWELWVRRPDAVADAVANRARARELDVHPQRLIFPDTIIVLVHASAARARELIAETLGAVAEVRPATATIRPFLERGDRGVGQGEFVDELLERIVPPTAAAPIVAVLDTGVSAGHPLIEPGLAGAYAYDAAWGADDHHPQGGHGTGMVGLVLYGDLESPLSDQRPVDLTHAAVSMKLLPPPGFDRHAPAHYGLVTQGAVAMVEIAHGATCGTYCLAATTDEFSPAGPSSWSGALDQIAGGASPGDEGDPPKRASERPKRLLLVATGNSVEGMAEQVLAPQPIEDPAQSWNALTIGGYTAKETVVPQDHPLQPLVAANSLSPFSLQSDMLPRDLTPIKPEVLFEAGNMLMDRSGFCAWNPSVSLLTTGAEVQTEPLTPFWATSAATAMAGNFVGRLEAALPGLWPETYRALTVQSADWPAPLRSLFIGRGEHWTTKPGLGGKAAKQELVRRVGYGVPDLERAVRSARNDLTLIAQAEIQPFAVSPTAGPPVYNEMHFYSLPWPRDALEALENEIVLLKVTLSYFMEPNLTGRAATRPDTYRSFGLRFMMKRPGENGAQFRARINAAQAAEGEKPEAEASHWLLGPKAMAAGSLHCDLWRGRAIELARHDQIAIVPRSGWWKTHVGQRRMEDKARYTLAISISARGHNVDLYTEVEARVAAHAAAISVGAGTGAS
ncbi:S8 family peptidase [Phenylobacterium soli]|uniref:Peptidase n=1 Tax=Phenylobacterium soli TaxID=2170551 RepID=A0A328AHQ8_9CAUL|nr:S8 family peptidase [Phenylobacterium soli]RAK54081.1 peptidase [Phenylobacterium soli]